MDGRDGLVGQDLVLGDEGAVHVGQEEADGSARAAFGCAGLEAMGRWYAPAKGGAFTARTRVYPPAWPTTAFPTATAIFSTADVLTLATVGEDGYPQVSEVWFLAEEGQVAMSLNTRRQKVKNLETEPACTLFLLDLQNPYRYLEIRGTAVVEPDDDRAFADAGRRQVRRRPA